MSRLTREMFCLMEGRHVHPSTLYPGGVGTVPTVQLFTDYLVRLMKYVEFMKKVVPLHDDLFDFFYEALPGYEKVGRRRILLGCWGSFQDPDVCDYNYKNMDDWGRAMFVTPGVVVDGKLVTTDLVDINLGIRILLGSSYYDDWQNERDLRQAAIRSAIRSTSAIRGTRPPCRGRRSATSTATTPGSCRRAGTTSAPAITSRSIPAAARSRASGRRRWPAWSISATSRRPATASRSICRRPRMQAGSRVRVEDPASGATPSSAIAPAPTSRPMRRRPRCTSSRRRWRSCTPAAPRPGPSSRCPEEAIGCGFHEAVRGVLSHHVVIRDGKIANYHPYPPTPWNANPRDIYGTPGPYEDAVQNTPIFEENGPDKFKGIDIMRAVRSFDPCLPCGVHMYLGDGKMLEDKSLAHVRGGGARINGRCTAGRRRLDRHGTDARSRTGQVSPADRAG